MLYGDAWGHDLDCCNASVLRRVKGLDAAKVPIHWIQMYDWWCVLRTLSSPRARHPILVCFV